jgi:beta-catenin-like protein 1
MHQPKSHGKRRTLHELSPSELLKKARLEETNHTRDGDAFSDDKEEPESSFAPGEDADYFAEEDEEGRFFGGGLTAEQKQILNIFDNVPSSTVLEEVSELSYCICDAFKLITRKPEEMSVPVIRRLLSRFEKAIRSNENQRSKYPDDPSK